MSTSQTKDLLNNRSQLNPEGKTYPIFLAYFQLPEEIRTIIIQPIAFEALHRQLRKVTKAKSQSPNDETLTKIIYLAYQGVSKKWTMPQGNWAFAISQFSITFQKET
jgi:transposase-like protein